MQKTIWSLEEKQNKCFTACFINPKDITSQSLCHQSDGLIIIVKQTYTFETVYCKANIFIFNETSLITVTGVS